MKTIRVSRIWFNDSGDVLITLLVPIDETRELRNDLFWYSGENMPDWKTDQQLSDEEVLKTRCYKQIKFHSIDQDIPNDCYLSLF